MVAGSKSQERKAKNDYATSPGKDRARIYLKSCLVVYLDYCKLKGTSEKKPLKGKKNF